MKRRQKYQVCVLGGLLLILIGMQMRLVESYVLSPAATRVLADWFGAPPATPTGALQQLATQGNARKIVSPPRWLGWASMSLGVMLVAYGVLGKRRQ